MDSFVSSGRSSVEPVTDPVLGRAVRVSVTRAALLPPFVAAAAGVAYVVVDVVSAALLHREFPVALLVLAILLDGLWILSVARLLRNPERLVVGERGFRAWPLGDTVTWDEVRAVDVKTFGWIRGLRTSMIRVYLADPVAFYLRRGRRPKRFQAKDMIGVLLSNTTVAATEAASWLQAGLESSRRGVPDAPVEGSSEFALDPAGDAGNRQIVPDFLPSSAIHAGERSAWGFAHGSTVMSIGLSALWTISLIVATGTTLAGQETPRVTATSDISASTGAVVYTDAFDTPNSGWRKSADVTSQYSSDGFQITGVSDRQALVMSPHQDLHQQLSIRVGADQTQVTDGYQGVGAVCSRGSGGSRIAYAFIAHADRTWSIEQFSASGGKPVLLASGPSPAGSDVSKVDVEGICATLIDGHTTRLVLYIDGTKLDDTTTSAASLPDLGWVGGIVDTSGSAPNSITATSFTERDLAR